MQVKRYVWSLIPRSLVSVAVLCSPAQADETAKPSGMVLADPRVKKSAGSAWRTIVTGRLGNGVRFAILPRRSNEPGVGLLMRNAGGFIAERRPGERGLAHLIEHIVFRSPTTGSPDDLGHFPHIGLPLTVPAAQVATTTWRESNWFLSTRTTRVNDLDRILALFREAATDLTFRADAVDIERVSVMREMADKTLGNRIYADYIAALAPGSPNDVLDAQNSDEVSTASIDTLRRLYHRLYRPEAMMIVVVGDVDPAVIRALVEKRFGDWKRDKLGPRRESVPLFQKDRLRPVSYSALPQGRRTAILGIVLPTPKLAVSRAAQAKAMLMDLVAVRAVSDRLTAMQPGASADKTGLYIENAEPGHRQIEVWDGFAAGTWRSAIARLRRVTCALKTAGFTSAEWRAAKRRVFTDLQQRTTTMATVPNVELAKDLSHAMADGRALISPDEMLRHAQVLLPAIDAREGSDWWQRQWHAGIEHLRVESPEFAQVSDPISTIRAADSAVIPAACKKPQY